MKRLLLYHHYNKYNNISEYVLYCLHEMRPYFNYVLFTSNSYLSKKDKDFLRKKYCDEILIRKNKGFDFGAWKDAINFLGFKEIKNYDSLVLMNDTCFGPLFDIGKVFKIMEEKNVDFWGITNHRKTINDMPGTDGPIPEHIQSYFLCFNKEVISSKIFKKFWLTVDENLMDVNKVIQNYETKLTELLIKEGFTYDVWIETSNYNVKHPNVLNCHTDILLKNGLPFVKIKSFLRDFENPKKLLHIIKSKYKYPVHLIENHISQISPPNNSLYFKNSFIDRADNTIASISCNKAAICLHITSIKDFKKYIDLIKNTKSEYDLFISTDNFKKIKKIKNILIENNLYDKMIKKDILIIQKSSLYPLIYFSEFIKNEYDIVGYFHIKKYFCMYRRIWLYRIIKKILSIDNIIQVFNNNKNVGIIITDIPDLLLSNKLTWGKNIDVYKKLWSFMNCEKEFSIDKFNFPIMPFETMFWFKRNALEFICNLSLNKIKEIKGKLFFKNEIDILKSIEKLLVYIAWDKYFDYRIITLKNANISNIEKRDKVIRLRKKNKMLKWVKIFLEKGTLNTIKLIIMEIKKRIGVN